jgi:hypothetical protein
LEDFAGSLRLRVFACAFDFLFGYARWVAARPRWDNCFALNGFALISLLSTMPLNSSTMLSQEFFFLSLLLFKPA